LTNSLYGAGVEYALHSLLILATQTRPISVADLASLQGIPEKFLAKLFTRMKKAGLVQATEGIAGGFTLARSPEAIPMLDAIQAVDPDRYLFACLEIRRSCTLFGETPPSWAITGPCRIHAFMQEAERSLLEFFASRTLADIVHEFSCKAPASFGEEVEAWFQQRRQDRSRRRPSPGQKP